MIKITNYESHEIYIYTKKSQENFINDKIQSSYVQCTLKEIQKPILTQQLLVKHDVQSNKIEHNINIKENTHNSTYINIYNKFEYRSLFRQLNEDQRFIFDDVMHRKQLYPDTSICFIFDKGC
jgi:hypothetical protein